MEEKLLRIIWQGESVGLYVWMDDGTIHWNKKHGELDLDLEREMHDISFWKYWISEAFKISKWQGRGGIWIYKFGGQKGDLTGHLINLWIIRI